MCCSMHLAEGQLASYSKATRTAVSGVDPILSRFPRLLPLRRRLRAAAFQCPVSFRAHIDDPRFTLLVPHAHGPDL